MDKETFTWHLSSLGSADYGSTLSDLNYIYYFNLGHFFYYGHFLQMVILFLKKKKQFGEMKIKVCEFMIFDKWNFIYTWYKKYLLEDFFAHIWAQNKMDAALAVLQSLATILNNFNNLKIIRGKLFAVLSWLATKNKRRQLLAFPLGPRFSMCVLM